MLSDTTSGSGKLKVFVAAVDDLERGHDIFRCTQNVGDGYKRPFQLFSKDKGDFTFKFGVNEMIELKAAFGKLVVLEQPSIAWHLGAHLAALGKAGCSHLIAHQAVSFRKNKLFAQGLNMVALCSCQLRILLRDHRNLAICFLRIQRTLCKLLILRFSQLKFLLWKVVSAVSDWITLKYCF